VSHFKTVAIFGVGLIGGSFALALRKAGFSGRILGVSSEATVKRALELDVIDAGASPQVAAEEADLIYLAQPIGVILKTVTDLNAWVRPEALVTDAGSTKQAVVQRAASSLTRAQFLGGHPLAGKEKRGLEVSDADLFRDRTYILTPQSAAEMGTDAAIEFRSWLEKIGAIPVILDAEQHDRTLAFTSHLPQLASTALAMLLAQKDNIEDIVFGPALVDSTRLALSPFEIWRDILATNPAWIDAALAGYINELELLRRGLNSPEMADRFQTAAAVAGRIRER
jgi:prephenate dehydrogenase